MTENAPIQPPRLTLEKTGMRLDYNGWRDRVTGAVFGSHSNQKEIRWYRFICGWENGQNGEIIEFEIAAKHEHPDNWVKGTAPENRKDVRQVARRIAKLWREEKLREQEGLRRATTDGAAVPVTVRPAFWGGRKTCEAWWVGRAVLLEPHRFGRHCREGWIDVLPLGDAGQEVAEYVAQVYADGDDEELVVDAAQRGLSLSDIRRVMAVRQDEDWQTAEKLMIEIGRSHRSEV